MDDDHDKRQLRHDAFERMAEKVRADRQARIDGGTYVDPSTIPISPFMKRVIEMDGQYIPQSMLRDSSSQ